MNQLNNDTNRVEKSRLVPKTDHSHFRGSGGSYTPLAASQSMLVPLWMLEVGHPGDVILVSESRAHAVLLEAKLTGCNKCGYVSSVATVGL